MNIKKKITQPKEIHKPVRKKRTAFGIKNNIAIVNISKDDLKSLILDGYLGVLNDIEIKNIYDCFINHVIASLENKLFVKKSLIDKKIASAVISEFTEVLDDKLDAIFSKDGFFKYLNCNTDFTSEDK